MSLSTDIRCTTTKSISSLVRKICRASSSSFTRIQSTVRSVYHSLTQRGIERNPEAILCLTRFRLVGTAFRGTSKKQ